MRKTIRIIAIAITITAGAMWSTRGVQAMQIHEHNREQRKIQREIDNIQEQRKSIDQQIMNLKEQQDKLHAQAEKLRAQQD